MVSYKTLARSDACEVLPADCWLSIFNLLDDDDFQGVSLVCKHFLKISNICKESLEVVHPKVEMLSKHLKRFKHLKKVNLRQFRGDLDEAISEIVRSNTSLNVLGVLDQYEFKAECLKDLDSNSKMKHLKALSYKGYHCLTPTDLELIANSFPNLEQLKFRNSHLYHSESWAESWDRSLPFPTVYSFDYLSSKLKLLNKIHIAGQSHICEQSLVALSRNCVFLKAVTICGRNQDVTENGIGLLLRNRPNLEALSLAYIKLNSSQSGISIENSIGHAKALTSLKFSDMDVSDMLLNAIAHANLPLKMFGLKFCKKFTVGGLLMVFSNNLTRLRICGAKLTNADMELLLSRDMDKLTDIDISSLLVTTSTLFLLSAKCPSLVEIRMKFARRFDPHGVNGNNNIAMSKNYKIQNLCLRNSRICDESVKKFALMFPNLRVLDLSNCPNVSCEGIEAIFRSCKFLKKLILNGYRYRQLIKDDREFPEVYLEDLTLSCSWIRDEGLAAIAKKCPRLVSLNLNKSDKITVEGLKQIIKNITTLKCLHIATAYSHITDGDRLLEWMLSTGNFASLKKIYVGRNYNFKDEKERDKFLEHGCLVLPALQAGYTRTFMYQP
ncbi:hypothetical protein PTKIN_Ptkin16aG0020900 [Pterospermum kingtungense]